MFGKIFASAFNGSMVGMGAHVFAVWGYAIANADASGHVEINPVVVAAKIGCGVDDVQRAIAALSAPDPLSRNKAEDGRRLVQAASFLYFMPSHADYRDIRSEQDRQQYMRDYMKNYRKNKDKEAVKVNSKHVLTLLAQEEEEVEVEEEEDKALRKSAAEHRKPSESDRILEAVLDAYHATLPKCRRSDVVNPKLRKRIIEAHKLAKQVCQQQRWKYEPAHFWKAYFTHCAKDPWMRGEVANPKNSAWKQNLGVLIKEDRFADVMNAAIEAMREDAETEQ